MVTLSLGIELTFTLKLQWLREDISLGKIEGKCIPISPSRFQKATAMSTMTKIVEVPTPHSDMNTSATDVSQAKLIQHLSVSRQENTVVIPNSLDEVLPHITNPASHIQSDSDAVPTPVNARAFSYLLERYQDREYIVRRFTEGFLTHFEGVEEELKFITFQGGTAKS